MLTKKKLILDFLKSHPFLFTAVFIAGLLNSISILLIPVFVGKFYQVALHTHSIHGSLISSWIYRSKEPVLFFVLFFTLIALRSLFIFFQKYLTGYGSEIFSKKLREGLLAKQMVFTMDAHSRKPVGKYLLRYSGDLNAIQRYISHGIITLIIDLLFMVLAFSFLYFLQPQLAMIIIVASPLLFGIIMILNRKLKLLTLKRRNIRSENLSFVTSRLSAMLTIKVFNREKIEEKKFEKNSDKLFNYGIQYYRWLGFIEAILPFTLYLMLGIVMVYVYYIKSVWKIDISATTLIIFLMITINILPVLKRIIRVNTIWQAGDISFQKVLNIFNAPEEKRDGSILLNTHPSSISFVDVSYGYENNPLVITDLSFMLQPNTITLLKGPQGSGKSTIFKLMLGLYKPVKGSILIDGINLNSVSPFLLRKKITLVSDELPLLGKTIFESVSYSRKEERREPAENMLRKLNFRLGDARELDLDYRVTEHGSNLSKGQRKLLLITRALLTRKKILLLDEPFSGLDSHARDNFIKQLNKLKEKRTILIADDQEASGLWIDQIISI